MGDGYGSQHDFLRLRNNKMKFFIVCAAAALLTLSACNDPKSDENEDDRTEQGEGEGDRESDDN